jgi:FKBP-type peptidyl-prolyl cis-trans isomerase SlyD
MPGPGTNACNKTGNTMIVEKSKVVSFHYTLKNEAGEELETSRDKQAMSYLHGANNIIPGLENAMEGRESGDAFSVTVAPEEAYGERREANVQRVPLKRLRGAGKLRPGQILNLQTQKGPVQVTVLKVGRFNVDVDANHPLAGQQLTFDVEITEIRDATKEETKHGHAHGPGGHQHG